MGFMAREGYSHEVPNSRKPSEGELEKASSEAPISFFPSVV